MRLRSRAKKQQHHQEGEDEGAMAELLPPELMHMLASYLTSVEDLAAASLTCRRWCKLLRSSITRVTLVVGHNGAANRASPAGTMEGLAKHSPVAHLEVLLNSRSDYTHTAEVLSSISSLPKLKHLRLKFLQSPTPKKGSWPVFFADNLDAKQLETLVVEAPSMPYIAISNLLSALKSPSSPAVLHTLDLKLYAEQTASQIPPFTSPAWLLDPTPRVDVLDADHLLQLADLASLRTLRCEVSSANAVFESLTKLSHLTELVLRGRDLLHTHVKQLRALKGLRRLSFNVLVWRATQLEALDLDHVQDLELSVTPDFLAPVLEPLLSRPPAGLKGLTLKGAVLEQNMVAQLAGLTNLTALHLMRAPVTAPYLDLTPLRGLTGLKQFTCEVVATKLLQIKFAPPPLPPKPGRVLLGPCQSVGKRRKSSLPQQQQQQPPADNTKWGDASALASAWPHLQQLHLAGLSPHAVALTSWEGLSSLTALTSLLLQFSPASPEMNYLYEGSKGLKQPVASLGGALPVVRLEHLPAGVQQLQLTNCYVGVPAAGCMRAWETLTTLSLSKCFVGSILKGASTRHGCAIVVHDSSSSPTLADGSPNPLLRLLQLTSELCRLELINMPALTDALLAAAAAQTQLHGLSSLSVLGLGNQNLTHGALLGLTQLRRLRELRWHVGDVLELMPDVNALGQLKALMTLSIPNWLHSQMERWGAYAVLDSMPLCDVNVELA